MLRLLTILLRCLAVLLLIVIAAINTSTMIRVAPVVSVWISYSCLLSLVLSFLTQTLRNRENNASRAGFGYKLVFVLLLLLSVLAAFAGQLLRL